MTPLLIETVPAEMEKFLELLLSHVFPLLNVAVIPVDEPISRVMVKYPAKEEMLIALPGAVVHEPPRGA